MEEKIDLIEELVVAAEEPEIVETKKAPIKNTKSHTCNRILEISQKYGFPTESKSTLMRKTKQELQLQLEGVIQKSMKFQTEILKTRLDRACSYPLMPEFVHMPACPHTYVGPCQ